MRGDIIAIYVTGEETEAQVINSPGSDGELAMGPGVFLFVFVFDSTVYYVGAEGRKGLGSGCFSLFQKKRGLTFLLVSLHSWGSPRPAGDASLG